jgi:hypothetical protein
MIVKGTFELTMTPEPAYDDADGVSLARARFEKRYAGPLEATSQMNMIGVRTPVDGSAGYVGVERVVGTLEGKRGAFVLQHSGIMTRGQRSLSVTIVPDSGTGELKGVAGRMDIQIVEGKHHYELDVSLGG